MAGDRKAVRRAVYQPQGECGKAAVSGAGSLHIIHTIYEQQKYMYDNRTHSVPDRIVSVSQPYTRPIVRGKAGNRWNSELSWTSV